MKKELRIVWLVLVTGIIIAFGTTAASAATITVTSLADGAVNAANCPSASNCRLRDAIAKAAAGDTINFSVTGTITLNSGQLVVNQSLNINGPGAAQLAISGNNASLIFKFRSGTSSVSGLAVINGWDNSGADSSGGIINQGSLTLTNCWVKNNTGTFSSAILSHGSLTINSSTFSGNIGEPLIRSDDAYGIATMTITNSTFSDNGGGIVNVGNTFSVIGSTISGNGQSGIANYGGNATVINSTISGNYSWYGGGFFLDSGTAKIINSTVTGNRAGSLGGGLYQGRGVYTLRNTIVAGNSDPDNIGPDLYGFGIINSQGYNLIGSVNSVLFTPTTGDKIGRDSPLDAKLGPLADNGGPTKTHALLTDSPAINAGDNCVLTNTCSADNISFNLTTEQRGTGFNRKLGVSVDIGAFETDAMPTTTTLTSSLNPSQFGQVVTFTASVVPAGTSFGVPTGTVQFKDGETNLGSPVALNGEGKAALSTSALLGGTHTVSALYIATGMFFSSAASIVHNVDLAKPTIAKSFSPTTIQAGENSVVTLTLTNRNNVTLTNALFTDNLANMSAVGGELTGTCPRWTFSLPAGATALNFRVTIPANGSCTVIFSVKSNMVGVHPNTTSGIITDQTPTAGSPSNTTNLIVVPPPVTNTTTVVTTSQNPILTGQNVTLTATVVPSVLGIVPTGTVQFKDGATNLGSPVTLDGSGKAVRNTSFSTGGTRTVSAVYNPTPDFNTSTGTLSQTVYVAFTTTSVTSSQNPIEAGQNITFTATVISSVSGIVPTGTVQFKNGATNLGSPVTLDGSGKASYITSLSTGSHNISAVYTPTGNFGPSTGQITQSVYASTSPTITKVFSPTTIQQGGTSTVTLTLTNPNAFSLTNATFTDVLVNMNAAGGAVTGTCAHTIPNIPPSIRNLTFNTITIPANGSCTVIFSVKSSAIGVHPNTTSGVTTTQTTTAGLPSNTANLTVTTPPDLTVVKSHTGNFTQGDTAKTYTITVTNSGGTPSSGTVSVVDTLPSGLTATAMSGTGWSCTLATLTCTRNDALAAAGSYPAITLTVDVAANAPASVTNTATVSGGGETNAANNTATDPTTIIAAATYAISGKVTNGGEGLSGVSVALTGTSSASTTTDAAGNYSFSNLGGGNYTITPSLNGYTFVEPSITVNNLIVDQANQNFATSEISYEGDVAARPSGDKTVDIFDMIATGNIIVNLPGTAPFAAGGEFQRADAAPRSTKGDGSVDVQDLVVMGLYAAAINPLTPASGAVGPLAPVPSNLTARIERGKGSKADQSESLSAAATAPLAGTATVSAGTVTASGGTAIVPIQLTSTNIAGVQFSMTYDATQLSIASIDAITDQAGNTLFTFNNTTPGQLGVIALRSPAGTAFPASTLLFNINFTVISGAASGVSTIGFGNTPVPIKASDPAGEAATSTTLTSGTVTLLGPTAASVSISGRVLTAAGRGIRNVTVTMIDSQGRERTAQTTSFGYYRFDDVEAGETVTITAKARRFKFSQSTIVRTTNDSVTDADFVTIE